MTTQVTPQTPAARLETTDQILALTQRLAEAFSVESALRDRERRLPDSELHTLFISGLGGITVPAQFGGADVSCATLAQVVSRLAQADGSIGQVPQNHFYALEVLRINGTQAQQQRLYQEVLDGVHLGNALAEFGTPNAHTRRTHLHRSGDKLLLSGRKFYATGAIYAQRIPVLALGEDGNEVLIFLPRETEGLTIIDDWSGFGQRTTGSGTVLLNNCEVDIDDVVPFHTAFERPTTVGPFAQLLHAAIDQGIARAAYEDMLAFVREHGRPWIDSGVGAATEDPLTLERIGRISARLSAGDALLEIAGLSVDTAQHNPTADSVAQASIDVAQARAYTTEVALAAGNLLFELGGSRSTLREYNLDRHWRNARTHTLHDPVRWKYHAVGNFYLNGQRPPRRGTI
ncbi:SfnB family sulfur acquisition oxidoreductase [Hafnia alvei]|uniref:SfnB family sulfur acquisition oxidoreductase n=1 Tax=Hafnia alvei TaxID=569 RepID=UPI001034A1DD|nr:SfnB family sulfur acquisition oxidoreductase [Hafnia alvei]TBL41345.1 SfnB family sulfur acquisition oxidoreductase [Hafnia alvei]TBL82514.1 SfnB family sulfur acquisition oxidoreductase [Hafnia alvei]